MEFLKIHVGQQWYPNQYYIMDLPSLSCRPIHRDMGYPPILETEIHHSRHAFTCWI